MAAAPKAAKLGAPVKPVSTPRVKVKTKDLFKERALKRAEEEAAALVEEEAVAAAKAAEEAAAAKAAEKAAAAKAAEEAAAAKVAEEAAAKRAAEEAAAKRAAEEAAAKRAAEEAAAKRAAEEAEAKRAAEEAAAKRAAEEAEAKRAAEEEAAAKAAEAAAAEAAAVKAKAEAGAVKAEVAAANVAGHAAAVEHRGENKDGTDASPTIKELSPSLATALSRALPAKGGEDKDNTEQMEEEGMDEWAMDLLEALEETTDADVPDAQAALSGVRVVRVTITQLSPTESADGKPTGVRITPIAAPVVPTPTLRGLALAATAVAPRRRRSIDDRSSMAAFAAQTGARVAPTAAAGARVMAAQRVVRAFQPPGQSSSTTASTAPEEAEAPTFEIDEDTKALMRARAEQQAREAAERAKPAGPKPSVPAFKSWKHFKGRDSVV